MGEAGNLMICPKCGKENDSFRTVCVYCGEPLTPGFVMCPVCGKVLRDGDAICPRCHSKVYDKGATPEDLRKNSTRTPMFVAKVPLSLLLSIILLGIQGTLFGLYLSMNFYNLSNLSVLSDVIGTGVGTVLALFTFVFRLFINTTKNVDRLEKRISFLKTLLFADLISSISLFAFAMLPVVLNNRRITLLDMGFLAIYVISEVVSFILISIFNKRARVRSR